MSSSRSSPFVTSATAADQGNRTPPAWVPAFALAHAQILEPLHRRGASFETRPMAAPQDEVDHPWRTQTLLILRSAHESASRRTRNPNSEMTSRFIAKQDLCMP